MLRFPSGAATPASLSSIPTNSLCLPRRARPFPAWCVGRLACRACCLPACPAGCTLARSAHRLTSALCIPNLSFNPRPLKSEAATAARTAQLAELTAVLLRPLCIPQMSADGCLGALPRPECIVFPRRDIFLSGEAAGQDEPGLWNRSGGGNPLTFYQLVSHVELPTKGEGQALGTGPWWVTTVVYEASRMPSAASFIAREPSTCRWRFCPCSDGGPVAHHVAKRALHQRVHGQTQHRVERSQDQAACKDAGVGGSGLPAANNVGL